MIAIQKRAGEYRSAVICDQCGLAIDDAFDAIVISSSAAEGAVAQAFHVHKRECEQSLSTRIDGLNGSEELSIHLAQLLKNALRKSSPDQVAAFIEELT